VAEHKKSNTNEVSHNHTVIEQFTKQAVPFTHISQHSNQYGMDLMFRLSSPKPNDTVLDVCCGTGIVTCEYAKLVSHVTGIDLTPAMIEQAKILQREKNLNNIDWHTGDVSILPFDDNSFSMVVTRYSFHHIAAPRIVLEEMKRVCKSNGKILVVDVTPDSDKKTAYNYVEKLRDPSHTEALTIEELRQMMESIGCINMNIKHHDLEMNLEMILQSSFPNPGDKDRIVQLFKQDLVQNHLGMKSHLVNNKIHFYFPVSMIIGTKET
jgi:ubiquinone/menaquinone biosynthesis C-methylase UbiE